VDEFLGSKRSFAIAQLKAAFRPLAEARDNDKFAPIVLKKSGLK
jgi:hypothetical protein